MTTLNNLLSTSSKVNKNVSHYLFKRHLQTSTIANIKAKRCCYAVKPIRIHTLNNMVKEMCLRAGRVSRIWNEPFSAHNYGHTSALLKAGCNKQLIMERMGHRSETGVRSYKWSNEWWAASHLLGKSQQLVDISGTSSKQTAAKTNKLLQLTS